MTITKKKKALARRRREILALDRQLAEAEEDWADRKKWRVTQNKKSSDTLRMVI